MPFGFLSDEQVARYGRFPEEPSMAELEQFFRLDRAALGAPAGKRRPDTRLGRAVQRDTVRMLGAFLTEAPAEVPAGAVRLRRRRKAERLRTFPKLRVAARTMVSAMEVLMGTPALARLRRRQESE